MSKSKNRGHRESRKPQQDLPEVPDLGRLSMPRKTNRAAAKYVASVGNLWDRRRADRKAVKNARVHRDAMAANPRRQHLNKAVREQMLRAMSGWSFDQRAKAFVTKDVTPERIEELLDAVINLGAEPVVLRVSGLSQHEARRVRGYLAKGSSLFVMNQRFAESPSRPTHVEPTPRERPMIETTKPMYVIALEEGDGGTLHTFTDPVLWEWLNTAVAFPDGAVQVRVPIPGTNDFASATIGASTNDLAHALVRHPSVTDLDDIDEVDFQESLDKLTEQVGEEHVYAGLWY